MIWFEYRKKQRQEEGERAYEPLEREFELAQTQPQSRVEALLETVNAAAASSRNLYGSFLAIGTYIGIIVAGTTDEQLLRLSAVKLPILNAPLPIQGFYIFVPWLFVLLHFNLLLQFYLLTDKLRGFEELVKELPVAEGWSLRKRLLSFPLVHRLAGQHNKFMQLLFSLMVWVTVVLAPLWLLLWLQIRFLPYHDPGVTWGQRGAVLADVLLLLVFWPRIVAGRGGWSWWSGCLFRWRTKVQQRADALTVGMLLLITWVMSFFIATVPEEPWERWLVTQSSGWLPHSWVYESLEKFAWLYDEPDVWQPRQMLMPTYWFFERPDTLFRRNLVLRRKVLTTNGLNEEALEALANVGESRDQEALSRVRGLDLRGRDLRYADMSGTLLPKVDFRPNDNQQPAQLQGANLLAAWLPEARLAEARLQGVNFNMARLPGADLGKAQLQFAELGAAQLQGVNLSEAQLQGANLLEAQLQGATLERAQLQGANLVWAQLQGADLAAAQLQGAYLNVAQLQGASLSEAQLQGANLRETQFQGAALQQAGLQHVIWQGAVFDYASLQGSDLAQLEDFALMTLQGDLEKQVLEPELRETVLERIISQIDPGQFSSAKQCLADQPERFPQCFTLDQEEKHSKVLAHYLASEIACEAAAAAQGIVNFRVRKSSQLAGALLARRESCSGIGALPQRSISLLQSITEESRFRGR
jgi:uncharacterized protein YjbI with pentapeptide repeats